VGPLRNRTVRGIAGCNNSTKKPGEDRNRVQSTDGKLKNHYLVRGRDPASKQQRARISSAHPGHGKGGGYETVGRGVEVVSLTLRRRGIGAL